MAIVAAIVVSWYVAYKAMFSAGWLSGSLAYVLFSGALYLYSFGFIGLRVLLTDIPLIVVIPLLGAAGGAFFRAVRGRATR
jgi:hypothetical protein